MRAYRVAYDGRPFHGFQRQPDVRTVEGALFDALRDLDVLDADAPKPAGYAAAGRTDAGVSARAQTVAFEGPDWLTPAALNSELPESVRAWAGADVPGDFHATHDARYREYVYFLYAPRGGDGGIDMSRDGGGDTVPTGGTDCDDTPGDAFDDGRARDALGRLAGEHDFHNLTPDDEGTVRDLSASAERDGSFLVVTLRAGGFARQLVRRVVGLVAAVSRGESPPAKVDRVLASDPLDGPDGVPPAPAYPLVLWDVSYGAGVDFRVDETAVESAREVWADRRAERLTAARVAGLLRDGIGNRR
ncbi:MAG: tRNA pseudouridine(38-40) synthase TruA [Haloarculaceae archaeon]